MLIVTMYGGTNIKVDADNRLEFWIEATKNGYFEDVYGNIHAARFVISVTEGPNYTQKIPTEGIAYMDKSTAGIPGYH